MQLGVRLFNRTTRRVTLTEEGRSFVELARTGLAALQGATAAATQRSVPRGLVRINTAAGFGRRYVLPLLPEFHRQHPQVQIELALNDQPVDLVAEGFDIGIRGGSQPPEGMVARKLCDMPALMVATPRYLRESGTPAQLDELSQHALIRLRFLSGRPAPWLFRGRGRTLSLELPARLWLSDPEMLVDAALLHLGIARVGRHHAHEALARGALVEVLAEQNAPGDSSMALFYPHRAGLAPRVRALLDYLQPALQALPALQGHKSRINGA